MICLKTNCTDVTELLIYYGNQSTYSCASYKTKKNKGTKILKEDDITHIFYYTEGVLCYKPAGRGFEPEEGTGFFN
jgi:hypothetical protein